DELAPRHLAGDDVPDVRALLLAAMSGDGGTGQQEAEAAGRAEGAEVGNRGRDADALLPGQAFAIAVLGQGGRGPPWRAQALPPLADGEVGIPILLEPGGHLGGDVARAGGGISHGTSPIVP